MAKSNRIRFDETPEQLEAVRKMGSKNKVESEAAQEAFAQILSTPVLQVIESAPVISNRFATQFYDEGTPPSIPLDPYFDIRNAGWLNVWSQHSKGGTATNQPVGDSEMFVSTYELASAFSIKKQYLRAARLDPLAAGLERLAQEILYIQETNAVNVLMGSLAAARIDGNASNTATNNLQVTSSDTADVFNMGDFNNMKTRYARQVASWVGSTPVGAQLELDTLIGSPEWMGQIRSMAYQPVNTRVVTAGAGAATYLAGANLAAPEALRQSLFAASGNPEIFGLSLVQSYDFGVARRYNQIFANYAGSTSYLGTGGTSTRTFSATADELVFGLNSNLNGPVRLRQRGAGGTTMTLQPDDTFTLRSDTMGLFGYLREGYASLDSRGYCGLIF